MIREPTVEPFNLCDPRHPAFFLIFDSLQSNPYNFISTVLDVEASYCAVSSY